VKKTQKPPLPIWDGRVRTLIVDPDSEWPVILRFETFTTERRRAQGRDAATLTAAGMRRIRLGIVRKVINDIIGKESDAECARRLPTVNAALRQCGLPAYPNEKALAVAIGRIRRARF
jgi:hypothetical protein